MYPENQSSKEVATCWKNVRNGRLAALFSFVLRCKDSSWDPCSGFLWLSDQSAPEVGVEGAAGVVATRVVLVRAVGSGSSKNTR